MLETATLTEKGLVDTGDVFLVAAVLAVAVGMLVGRWLAVLAGPALVGIAVGGIAAGWWGGGLGDEWASRFVALAVAAAMLAAIGVGVALAAGTLVRRRGLWKASVASAALAGVAALLFVSTRPPDVERVQAGAGGTLYFLGDSFEGYRLTHAEGGDGRALFAYGDCEQPFGHADGGCTVPIQLQEHYAPVTGAAGCGPPPGRARPKPEDPAALLVFAGSTMIEIYAHDRARAQRAASALRAVDRSCS